MALPADGNVNSHRCSASRGVGNSRDEVIPALEVRRPRPIRRVVVHLVESGVVLGVPVELVDVPVSHALFAAATCGSQGGSEVVILVPGRVGVP